MDKSLTFITGNPGKAEQFSKYVGIPLDHQNLELTEIQSLDLEEVIKHKVMEAYQQIKKPVIVDDTSLTIHVLGKLPGPFIKFFLKEIGPENICKMLNQFSDRSALAEVAIGLYDGTELKIFKGETEGEISSSPKGTCGFGWDVIFIPNSYNQTRAEMNESDYDQTSPRKKALDQLEKYLKTNGK